MSKANKNDNKTLMLSVIRMAENRNCEILDFCIDGEYCEFKLKIKTTHNVSQTTQTIPKTQNL